MIEEGESESIDEENVVLLRLQALQVGIAQVNIEEVTERTKVLVLHLLRPAVMTVERGRPTSLRLQLSLIKALTLTSRLSQRSEENDLLKNVRNGSGTASSGYPKKVSTSLRKIPLSE